MTVSSNTTKTVTTDICLFDLDGTLVDTTVAAINVWTDLCNRHGVDAEDLLRHSHGVRSTEIIQNYFPDLDNSQNQISRKLEEEMVDKYRDTVKPVDGSIKLLNALPKEKWAIVTSGPKWLTHLWFDTTPMEKVRKPDVFITSELVTKGKPDPMCYMMGKNALTNNNSSAKAVVFEDAPAGIKAGKAMGATVIGITTTYDKSILAEAGADYIVPDLTAVSTTTSADGKIVLTIVNQ